MPKSSGDMHPAYRVVFGSEVAMRESELLGHIYRRTASMPSDVLVGPGDDCAVLANGSDRPLLVATDQVIGGRHFDPAHTPIDLIARKAIARNVSDIAAMAGSPTHALCAASLPEGYDQADELFDRAHHWAHRFGCPLVGGDIARTDGPLSLTVTILGRVHPARGAVLRSGARAGDRVFVSGPLGHAYESGWHLTFEPRVPLARRLADTLGDRLHAMIDLSDGVGIDGGRIAQASRVRLELDAHALPLRTGTPSWREAVGGGEDYELLVCADAESVDGLTPIGRVVPGEGCVALEDGREIDISWEGWDHA